MKIRIGQYCPVNHRPVQKLSDSLNFLIEVDKELSRPWGKFPDSLEDVENLITDFRCEVEDENISMD